MSATSRPVDSGLSASPAPLDELALFEEARRRRRRRWAAIIALLLVAAAVGVPLGLHSGNSASQPPPLPKPSAPPPKPAKKPRGAQPISVRGATPHHPYQMAAGPNGSLYIVDAGRDQILRRSRSGRFSVVAGSGKHGFSGDGGQARRAKLALSNDSGIAVTNTGTIYIADSGNQRVREIQPNGVITTIAGGGNTPTNVGDYPALGARLKPGPLTLGPDGDLYVGANAVYRLDAGTLQWVVGANIYPPRGFSIYSNPAQQSDFTDPVSIAFDGSGDLLVAGGGGFGLYERTTAGKLIFVQIFRGDGFPGTVVSMPDGNVLMTWRDGLHVFHPTGRVTSLKAHLNAALGHFPNSNRSNIFIGGNGAAVMPNGTIFTDTNTGNSFTLVSAIVKVPAGGGSAKPIWRS